ncbi:DUF131 domain-containing protein [Fervidicoccus fontis]|uniref:DUF131 domain-containing protein n=2 Tax=Fervidicoccus fontis TaxID=683846 RepID=I0A308_FERFK|nr:DUF131 domain-containing protein [Fervidicoccus fontis]AFH43365.1 hypothetical protein FFONT_1377 [Fervidicoccus fontis Kam940]MBE9390742.1 DUF131 domain-containing protein [Fervidicoccus fontis]
MIDERSLLSIGFLLVFIGIIVIMGAFLYMFMKSPSSSSEVQGGGIIFIGPIPIIFGSSKNITKSLLIVAMVISLVLIVVYILSFLRGSGYL